MKIPSVLMRGGTSKGLFFHDRDLPQDAAQRDRFLLAAYGSPDPDGRQVDGIGGAISTTSKVAIIKRSDDSDIDVTYEFGQVSIKKPLIDRRGNCGNISSAVGPFAVDEGLVEAREPVTPVRFLNVNTNKRITAHVPTRGGHFDPTGDFVLPGVPGSAAKLKLDYLEPAGSVTNKLLPTGHVRDELKIPGLGTVEISIVDAANPLVFIKWEALGLDGSETPDDIDADKRLLANIESIRSHAGVLAGISATPQDATKTAPSVPKLTMVGPPRDYLRTDGGTQNGRETTLRAAMMSMGQVHRSFAFTGGICTAVAINVPGTIPSEVAGGPHPNCQIGHPAGIMPVQADVQKIPEGWHVASASGIRTARRLMEGSVLVPNSFLSDRRLFPI